MNMDVARLGGAQELDAPFQALPPVLDLAYAERLQQSLQDVCTRESPLVVNGQAVERVSTACLQVLIAAARAARMHDREFRLQSPSPALSAAIEDLGLAHFFGGEPA
jgi:chemotaxis protein CheX